MYKNFNELVKERQSCRSFSDKPVEKELLYGIAETALLAPSACNSQPWRVYITCTAEENAKMAECLQDDGRNAFLDHAKAFIAVCETGGVNLRAGTDLKFSSTHFVEYDVGEFIAYLTLAAKDKGLDSCIIGWVNNDKLNKTFGIQCKCNIVVAFGYGKDKLVRKKTRLTLNDILLEGNNG